MNKKLLACILIPIASVAIASTATYAAASVPGLNKEVDELQEQVATLQEQVAELQAKATQLKNEMNSSIDQVKSDYGNKINNVQSQIDTLNNQLIALSAKLEADKEALQSDYNTKVTNLKAYIDEQCALLQANIDTNTAAINTLTERRDNEIGELEAKYQQDIADLKEEFEGNLDELSEAISNLDATFNQELDDLDTKYEEELANLEKIVKADVKALSSFQSQFISDREALKAKLASDIEKLESDFEDEVSSINTEISSLTTSLSDLSNQMNLKIASIQSDYNNKISDLIDRIETLETVTYHTVTFDTGCDVEISSQKVKHGEKIIKPADPTRKFYTFEGWTYKGETWLFYGSIVTENMKLVASWSQTEEQKTAEEEYDQTYASKPLLSDDGKTITYGLYPQTRVNDFNLILELNMLTTVDENGWYLYNNAYYTKMKADPTSPSYTFDDGTPIESGKTYWFKCEPITWNVLSNDNGECYILSNVLLDAQRYGENYNGTKTKTDYKGESESVYANNYKYSDIRTWLNTDFYNTAFALGHSNILTTTVDNSPETTGSSSNPYACNNTQDKVFLPSYQDYLNSSYGFSTSYSPSDTRSCKTTDYAKARGSYYNTYVNYLNNGWYWTRSPGSGSEKLVYYAEADGKVFYGDGHFLDDYYSSVRPALTIKIA